MMNVKGAAGYRGLQHTPDFQQATGAMHRPRIRIEIGSHDPAFAELPDSLLHHSRLGAALDEPASIAAKQN
ncbi:hypothetical protein [Bradyrhizobium cytisi]|uniref:hypothetical protein n=1 Tax=Bradyrhizobium cytisi TaxID=515489 RepID=UPI001652E63D|nr:hypothetical protein [Bradyrhizobium cytisi]